ncbi:hypothetical protein ABC383_25960 [Noviherbaspirillum sp. 1P10PC]
MSAFVKKVLGMKEALKEKLLQADDDMQRSGPADNSESEEP